MISPDELGEIIRISYPLCKSNTNIVMVFDLHSGFEVCDPLNYEFDSIDIEVSNDIRNWISGEKLRNRLAKALIVLADDEYHFVKISVVDYAEFAETLPDDEIENPELLITLVRKSGGRVHDNTFERLADIARSSKPQILTYKRNTDTDNKPEST